MQPANPYLEGVYGPIATEHSATLKVHSGDIPRDIAGTYLRNGPNARWSPKGRYHWFDGDGMLHAVRFHNGAARYTNRYVQTEGFRREAAAKGALWQGLLMPTGDNPAGAPYKDTANTDVIVHRGEALALWYVAGTPYRVDLDTLETLGATRFGSDKRFSVSAHAKVDPVTDELMFFDYGRTAPYMQYGVVGADGLLKRLEPITLPGPRLPHDMAITANYSVLMDLPVIPDAEAAKKGRWVIRYAADQPARFGVLPRHGGDADVRWFEAAPCYIYHVVNAWEEGDTVVMVGCRTTRPIPPSEPRDGDPLTARMMANLRLKAQLHEWRFDLTTGQTSERPLDDRFAEFPTLDGRVVGRRSRRAYAMLTAEVQTLAFEGIIAYDLDGGPAQTTQFGPGWYGNEVGFAPRIGGTGDEGDGHLVTYVSHPDEGSRCLVYDATDITAGPVVTLAMPGPVPIGFHACWAPLT